MERFFVRGAALIDGTGDAPLPGGMMVIEDGKIVETGTQFSTGDAKVLDLSEYHILPGLVDSHTHLSIVPALGNQSLQMIRPVGVKILSSIPNIRRQLESGVTTMRIMGEEDYIDIDLKDAINKRVIPGPRLFVSTVILTASNGHSSSGTTTDTEYEVRKQLRKNFNKGADFGKMFITGGNSSARTKIDSCTYTRQEIAAAVEECSRMGTYVAVHAHGGPGVDICIEEGVKTVEHGSILTKNQIDRMKDKDMWVVCNFAIMFHPSGLEQTDFSDPVIREKCLQGRKIRRETTRMVIDSGVNYAIGTDSMHGMMPFEMQCLVDFGASNMEAIIAATASGARVCMMDKLVGTLEPGKFADFIAVNGDPLADIKAMNNVVLVCKAGEILVDKR